MDVLSDILQMVRLRGTVYFQSDFAGAWGMQMEASDLAAFHMVVRGNCWLRTADSATPVPLAGGDMVVFLRGGAHWLADRPDGECVPGRAVIEGIENGRHPFREGSLCTTLVCGHFEFDRGLHHPLIQGLPDLVHLRGAERPEDGSLDKIVSLIVQETKASQAGTAVVVDRLAEILFIQILRSYMAKVQPGGFWAPLQDREISQALTLLHTRPQASWTIESIARSIGMSRSAFAGRFKQLVGETPIRYLTGWRMQRARKLLRETNMPVHAVAQQVGYNSQAAFIRAFQREFRQNPGAMRQA
ncbi:MAG: AraC family transcriptional regulator [Anaerolineae bacterium]